jgi:hydrogenase expression/formation protein HypD
MMRVPGSSSSLERERSNGRDIRVVYSPLDILDIATKNPSKEVIFLSVGFETTTPTVAATIKQVVKEGLDNISFLTANKLVPPALEALLNGKTKLDGFLLPGHVSTIIGGKAYLPIINKYKIPSSIAGFEPVDIMGAILELTKQAISGEAYLSIEYSRAVTMDGNTKAQRIMEEVFEPIDAKWRGIGVIEKSGLKIRDEYTNLDAALKFSVQVEETKEDKGCICGEILQGLKDPPECPLFGKRCTPKDPVGACMVSQEGTCAAWYKYRRVEHDR